MPRPTDIRPVLERLCERRESRSAGVNRYDTVFRKKTKELLADLAAKPEHDQGDTRR